MSKTLLDVISAWPHDNRPDTLHPKSHWSVSGEGEVEHTVSHEREEGKHSDGCRRCQIERWACAALKNVGRTNVLRQVVGELPDEGEEGRDALV